MHLGHRGILLPCLLLLLLAAPAWAQLTVGLELRKHTHVMGEAVYAEVTVFNRAGRDIILDGPANQSWLALNVTNPDGRVVSKTQKKVAFKPTILRGGQALKRQVKVDDYVTFDDYGNYGLTASVYFPEKQNFFASERQRVDITDGQVFWEQVVGVPQGQIGAGSYRKYELLTFNSSTRTELYARIRDDTGHLEFGTFNLGTIILYRDPQITVDSLNQLHALFMAAPRTYRHLVINTDGKIISQKVYTEDKANRPRLLISQNGDVNVRGGIYKDPSIQNSLQGGQGNQLRNISDRRIPGT